MEERQPNADPRSELFATLKQVVGGIEDIKYVDLWNQNVDFIEEDTPWPRPAVFLELEPITWRVVKGDEFYRRYMRGEGTLRLHIVTDWVDGGQEKALSLSAKIWEELFGDTRGFSENTHFEISFPSQSVTNHNHDEVLETVDIFTVRYMMGLGALV